MRQRSPWTVLVVSLAGLFTVFFTVTILSVAIPRMAREFSTSQSTITWVITGPILAFGVSGPAVGKAGDLWGHRRMFVVGLGGCAVFAAATAVAPNAAALITFRILGAGFGASAGPASMAMINRVFSPMDRVRALGYWSFVVAAAPVFGIVAGGPIVEAFGWRWIFAAQCPLCLGGIVLALRCLPETPRIPGGRFDAAGAVVLAISVTGMLLVINRGSVLGWTSPSLIAMAATCVAGLVLFVRIEQRAIEPLIPLRYLSRRNFVAPIATLSLVNFAYMGSFVLTPLLLQNVLGRDESHTGRLLIGRPLALSVAAPLAAFVTVRVGEKVMGITGALVVGGSMMLLTGVTSSSGDLLVLGGLVMSGIGSALMTPAMSSAVANSVDERDLGVAGAAQQLMSQVGVATGIQVLLAVQSARSHGQVDDVSSYTTAYLVGAGAAVLGALTAGAVTSRSLVRR